MNKTDKNNKILNIDFYSKLHYADYLKLYKYNQITSFSGLFYNKLKNTNINVFTVIQDIDFMKPFWSYIWKEYDNENEYNKNNEFNLYITKDKWLFNDIIPNFQDLINYNKIQIFDRVYNITNINNLHFTFTLEPNE